MSVINFQSNYRYTDRKTKAKFVFERYKGLLKGKILDVGADQCFLKENLPDDVEYIGIGLGDNPDLIKLDLEKEKLPFRENEFNCVLCLDVLEHLDNIHEVFDELSKVSSQYLILSLPNPWRDFMNCIQRGKYRKDKNMKFYGLPLEPQKDRHKWFFSSSEAREFIKYRAIKNNLKIIDVYCEDDYIKPDFIMAKNIKKILFGLAAKFMLRKNLAYSELYNGTTWWVLEKIGK